MYKTISNGYSRTIEVLPNGIMMEETGNQPRELVMALASYEKKEILNAMAEIWTDEFKEVMEEFDERFKKYYYRLPDVFGEPDRNYLNEALDNPYRINPYFLENKEDRSFEGVKTKFTRQEFAKIMEEFPEYSIMVEEEIKEDD